MSCKRSLAASTALATFLLAQAAAADITPEQVWADLRGYMEGYGYSVEGSESTSGDTLTITDITMSFPMPEDEGTLTMMMPELVLTGDGGKVDVAWPATMPMTLDISAEGETVKVVVLYEIDGLEMTVSGTLGDSKWDYTANSISISLDDLNVEGESIGRDIARGVIAMNAVTGSSTMKTGDMREVFQEMSVDSLTYDIAARDPDDADNNMLMKGGLQGMTYGGGGTLPLTVDATDPAATLYAMDVDGQFAYTAGNSQFNFVDGGDAVSFTSTSGGGSLNIDVNADTWSYGYLVKAFDMQASGGDIPFPVALKAGEIGGNFAFPVSKAEEPSDVALGINLTDFTMNDLIWNIFDPGAQLPRDPATIKVDVTGKARMLFDLFDPEQAEKMAMSDMPAELHELALNSLMVKAVGAVLTGSGAFTFDNTDLESFDGLPRPMGEVNAELTGANALLDKLIAMGVLPEDQAMGFRMMMGMFAVPAGDDKMTSKLEINEEGHIIANGQRIQ